MSVFEILGAVFLSRHGDLVNLYRDVQALEAEP